MYGMSNVNLTRQQFKKTHLWVTQKMFTVHGQYVGKRMDFQDHPVEIKIFLP